MTDKTTEKLNAFGMITVIFEKMFPGETQLMTQLEEAWVRHRRMAVSPNDREMIRSLLKLGSQNFENREGVLRLPGDPRDTINALMFLNEKNKRVETVIGPIDPTINKNNSTVVVSQFDHTVGDKVVTTGEAGYVDGVDVVVQGTKRIVYVGEMTETHEAGGKTHTATVVINYLNAMVHEIPWEVLPHSTVDEQDRVDQLRQQLARSFDIKNNGLKTFDATGLRKMVQKNVTKFSALRYLAETLVNREIDSLPKNGVAARGILEDRMNQMRLARKGKNFTQRTTGEGGGRVFGVLNKCSRMLFMTGKLNEDHDLVLREGEVILYAGTGKNVGGLNSTHRAVATGEVVECDPITNKPTDDFFLIDWQPCACKATDAYVGHHHKITDKCSKANALTLAAVSGGDMYLDQKSAFKFYVQNGINVDSAATKSKGEGSLYQTFPVFHAMVAKGAPIFMFKLILEFFCNQKDIKKGNKYIANPEFSFMEKIASGLGLLDIHVTKGGRDTGNEYMVVCKRRPDVPEGKLTNDQKKEFDHPPTVDHLLQLFDRFRGSACVSNYLRLYSEMCGQFKPIDIKGIIKDKQIEMSSRVQFALCMRKNDEGKWGPVIKKGFIPKFDNYTMQTDRAPPEEIDIPIEDMPMFDDTQDGAPENEGIKEEAM